MSKGKPNIVTGLYAGEQRNRWPLLTEAGDFSLFTASGVHTTSRTVGTRACVKGVKQPLHEVDHPTPPNPVVKNA